MDTGTETWVTSPDNIVSALRREACLVHIYPTGAGMGTRYPLRDTPIVLGRGGDFTLRELAAAVKACVRKEELFARYGGEEFAIVLPETSHEGAAKVAERIRVLVEHQPFEYDGTGYQVTISVGVAVTLGEEP